MMDWLNEVASQHPIRRGGSDHPRVMLFTHVHGEKRVLKVCRSAEAAVVEATALQSLAEVEAPVPALIDADRDQGLLLMTYVAGTVWGDLPRERASASQHLFEAAWSQLSAAWECVRPKLSAVSTAVPVARFSAAMESLGNWLCPQASDPQQAMRLWDELVQLSIEAPQTFGSLDYNPYNVILTEDGVVFVDFECCGMDWDDRRKWQYVTQIRTVDGQPCWQPYLQQSMTTPAAQAHYLLFAAQGLRRMAEQGIAPLPTQSIWSQGPVGDVVSAWRSLWT